MPSSLLNFSLENALVTYVSGNMVATGVNNLNYYRGIAFSGVKQPPCVIIHCADIRRAYPNANLYNATVTFDYITQIDAPNSYQAHTSGVALLRNVLSDCGAMKAAFNPPVSGVDTRIEPSLFLYGTVEQEVKPYIVGDTERSVGQTFSYRFDCSN